ncbi:MAG: hypothetical protein HC819_15000 [Cyclobacteriaceae bacterium]|nr:hypothetical protein [Cyclobacteriaceae bacterium]
MDLNLLYLIDTMHDTPDAASKMEHVVNVNEMLLDAKKNELSKEAYWENKLVCLELKAYMQG